LSIAVAKIRKILESQTLCAQTSRRALPPIVLSRHQKRLFVKRNKKKIANSEIIRIFAKNFTYGFS